MYLIQLMRKTYFDDPKEQTPPGFLFVGQAGSTTFISNEESLRSMVQKIFNSTHPQFVCLDVKPGPSIRGEGIQMTISYVPKKEDGKPTRLSPSSLLDVIVYQTQINIYDRTGTPILGGV